LICFPCDTKFRFGQHDFATISKSRSIQMTCGICRENACVGVFVPFFHIIMACGWCDHFISQN